jgi:hypothetical protein
MELKGSLPQSLITSKLVESVTGYVLKLSVLLPLYDSQLMKIQLSTIRREALSITAVVLLPANENSTLNNTS